VGKTHVGIGVETGGDGCFKRKRGSSANQSGIGFSGFVHIPLVYRTDAVGVETPSNLVIWLAVAEPPDE
jgi:hypothetical protein